MRSGKLAEASCGQPLPNTLYRDMEKPNNSTFPSSLENRLFVILCYIFVKIPLPNTLCRDIEKPNNSTFQVLQKIDFL